MKSHLDMLANGSAYHAMILFLCKHPPLQDDGLFCVPEKEVDEGYSAAIHAAFPNPGESILSVGEVTRRKVMILGLELVDFERVTMSEHGCVWRTPYPVPVVRLPDGKLFGLYNADDLAKLRQMLESYSQPHEEPLQLDMRSQPPADGG